MNIFNINSSDIAGWLMDTNIQALLLSGLGTYVYQLFQESGAVDRAIVHDIKYKIQDIVQEATSHYCSSANETINETRILSLQQNLYRLAVVIKEGGREEKCQAAFIKFRQAITGGDFDSSSRVKIAFENEKLILLRSLAEDLKNLV